MVSPTNPTSTIRMSTTVSAATLLAQLQWRYATKKFDPMKKIAASDWQALEQAMTNTPRSRRSAFPPLN
jgi:hypothetical protein